MFLRILAIVGLIGASLPIALADQIASPDGKVVVEFTIGDGGQPLYRVNYDGRALVDKSRLGFEPDLLDGFELISTSSSTHKRDWINPFGERRDVPDRYAELAVGLKHRSGRRLQLDFRAYDEGIAFRYRLPADKASDLHGEGEHTEFRLPAGVEGYEEHGTEGEYRRTPIADFQPWCERPLTLVYPDGRHAALAEAANDAFPRMLLSPLEGVPGALVTALGGRTSNTASLNQRHDATFTLRPGEATPWRALVVGNRPGELLERNYLLLNLNEPSRIADTSWIKPGKAMRDTTLTTANAKAIIDFAATAGLDYVHLDAGWYGPEHDRASDAAAVEPRRTAELDLQEIIRYGKTRDVGVFLYVNDIAMRQHRDQLLPLYEKWGVAGIKLGFIKVGPQADSQWTTETIAKAAEHHLMLNIHDGYRATGNNRTYPNLMTVEGIRGNEHMPTAEHNCTLPFTRYVGGVGDYTVCYYSDRIKTTHAHQLAMAVVSFSPVQWIFWYDRPSMYEGEPEVEFFRAIPTVWDETRVLAGEVGQFATVARRRGNDWFIGTINGADAHTLDLKLDFLPAGVPYTANIYADDATAGARTHVRIDRQDVDATMTLPVLLLPTGGHALWLSPKR
jgi:alpha-glucosidase